MRVIRQLQNVRHGVPVSHDGPPGLILRIERRLACDSRDGIVERHVVALNAVGTPDGTSEHHASQKSDPAVLLGQLVM
jgi:hypothetical protein